MATNVKFQSNATDIQATIENTEITENESTDSSPPEPIEPEQKKVEEVPWSAFLKSANQQAIRKRICSEIEIILTTHNLQSDCCLAILEPADSIDSFDLDRIYRGLNELNPNHDKRVILFVISAGGSIEPAYQISKLCKSFSKGEFIVVVPRNAKSAATMIAIGADEIHMGLLGQLGPIDPQIGGLPALGVSQALRTIASVAQKYPGSAEMFAKYLRQALTVEQIGYCDRISESAMQYAQRLLSTKPALASSSSRIARELVYEYKDHGFVIDLDEARKHLGEDWIKTGTAELRAAEHIYTLIELINLLLRRQQSKRLLICGNLLDESSILILENEDD